MLRKFYPNYYVESTYSINFKKLYEKGYRGLIFDIDNTLVEHGADADERATLLFAELKKIGFQVCLLSNNKIERVERFNHSIKVNYIHDARKPSTRNYKKAMEVMHTDVSNTIFIGDQLFTDIYGANRAGMKTFLVKPIDKKEEIQIVFKRYLERIVLYFYKKQLKKTNK